MCEPCNTSHVVVQFRLTTRSLRCINRRKVLFSPRGPFFLASEITTRGNSGVLCQGLRIESFAIHKNESSASRSTSQGGHPPLMGGPRHRSKPAVGMGYFYSATDPRRCSMYNTPSPTNGLVACVCRPRLGASSPHCLCHCSALHAQRSVSPSNAP